jgi:hypothetical protein
VIFFGDFSFVRIEQQLWILHVRKIQWFCQKGEGFCIHVFSSRWYNNILFIYLRNQWRQICIQHTKDKIDPDYFTSLTMTLLQHLQPNGHGTFITALCLWTHSACVNIFATCRGNKIRFCALRPNSPSLKDL